MGAVHAENFTEQLFQVVHKGWLRGMYLRTERIPYSEDKTEREYRLMDKKHRLQVSFRARPLPGCCGVLVVYYLRPETHVKDPIKVFSDTCALIIEAAGLAKFGNVLLTQTEGSAGYSTLNKTPAKGSGFTNWKTGNRVGVFQFETKEPKRASAKAPVFNGQ